jgi:tetratricopeptide (TPR) repeat protein
MNWQSRLRINVELTPQEQAHFAQARPVNREAYQAYLIGRYLVNIPSEENLKKALPEFQHAIQLDPGFAPAFAGLSLAYTWAAWINVVEGSIPQVMNSRAKAAAEKAVQLDDSSAEAHCALGVALENFFDWPEAETELRQAVALNPNYAYAHMQYGIMLAQLGRLPESLAENTRAVELDPLTPGNYVSLAVTLAWQDEYQAAMEQERRASELYPNSSLWATGWVDLQAGNVSQAIPELQKAYALESAGFEAGYLGYAYAASGDRTRAMAMIEELRKESSHSFVSPLWPAIIYIGLGERQRSLDGMEKAYEIHDPWLMQIKMDKVFDPLRSEPRFIELLRKVHLDK